MNLLPYLSNLFIFGLIAIILLIFLIYLAAAKTKLSQRFAKLIYPLAIGLGFFVFPYLAFAQGDPTLTLAKSFGGSNAIEVESGTEFTYFINYRCASALQNCLSTILTDTLPSEVEFVSVSGPLTDIDSTNYDDINHELTVQFIEPLPAGRTGILEVVVLFPPGTLPGTTATNTASSSTTGGIENSGPAIATVTGGYEMFIDKSVVGDFDDAVIGSDFTTNYQLQVCNPDDEGGIRLTNPMIIDTLPPEATFVSASNGGMYNPLDHTITWTPPNLPDPVPIVDGCSITLDVAVRFDENGRDGAPGGGDDPISGNTATNTMQLTGSPEDGTPDINLIDPVDITFRLPSFGDSLNKRSTSPSSYIGRATEELPGGEVIYTVSYQNTGTITATHVILTDTLPSEVFVTSIGISPVISDALGFYETNDNPGVWLPFPGNGYAAGATLVFTDTATAAPNDVELAVNDYVTRVRWEIGEIPFGLPAWSANIGTFVKPGTPVNTTFQNCVSSLAEFEDGTIQTTTHTACADVRVIEARAIPRVDKISTVSSGLPETVTEYTLRGYNANVAHNDVEGPIFIADFLPEEFEVVIADAGEPTGYRIPTPAELATNIWFSVSSSNGAPAPTFQHVPAFNANNDTLLGWEFTPYSMPPGDFVDITLYARVKSFTTPQQLNNRATMLIDPSTVRPLECDSSDGNNSYVDADDIDGDGDTAETGCSEPEVFNVRAFLSMDSEKFVWGELGTDWSDYSTTVVGGKVDFRMIISNTSNVTATDIVAYDIFPHIGDTGVIDPSNRDSEWAPHLISPITDTQGLSLTISYSQSTNPCRPELISSGPSGCVSDWSETPPTDITSVKALRFDFCDNLGACLELAPDNGGGGGLLDFNWHMVAPNGVITGDIAYNSFGFTAEGGGLTLLPSEPIRVGIEVFDNPDPGYSIGNFVWLDVFGQQNDGVQQPEEEGINGIRVELWDDTTNTLVGFRTTGPDNAGNSGYYLFNNVITGTYTVRFFPPVTYATSPPNAVINDTLDSDGETAGVDATFGPYLETGVINVGLADDFTWDQGMWLPTDYGDAPANYPTEAASQANPADAARHIINPAIFLGSSVDAELDGQPDQNALGDDTGAGDDEDGIRFPTYIGPESQPSSIVLLGENTSVDITTTVPATGYLTGWIDFNGDGDWTDPGEQIISDELITSGTATYSYTVPTTATVGTTYARFRLSTQPGLQPTGSALDGEVEDYKVQILPLPVKSLINTSASHTAGSEVTIGEVITYRLEIPIPEGSLTNFVVTDLLPNRLQYVDAVAPTVSVTATTGVTWTQLLVENGPFGSGTDPRFNFGTVTNDDTDLDIEYIVIDIQVIVLNHPNNNAGTNRNNAFRTTYDSNFDYTSENVRVSIVEPFLNISKVLVTPLASPLDAGSSVTYEIVVSHDPASDIDAKDVMITDTFPAELANVTVDSIMATGVAPPSASLVGNLVTIPNAGSFDLPLNAVITLTVSADLAATILPEALITNTADLTWTSLEGPSDEERDGTGGIDDYSDSDSDSFTTDAPSVSKALIGTSAAHTTGISVTIGEVVTYSVSITLPESTIPSIVITDNIPAGMGYIANSVVLDPSGLNGSTPTISESSGGGSGDDVVFTLGNFTVTADNVTTNNTLALTYQAVVLNVAGNVGVNPPGYTDLTNTAAVQIASNPPDTTNPVTVTVVEPQVIIAKSFDRTQVAPNEQVTVTFTVTNTGTSTAFDLIIDDPIDSDDFHSITEGSTPAGFTFTLVPAGADTIVRYSGGSIGAGNSVDFTFFATVVSTKTASPPDMTNIVTVTQQTTLDSTADDGVDSEERDEPDTTGSDTLTVIIHDLVINKDDGQTDVAFGETVTYTLTISNVGNAVAPGVVVTDTVPANTTFSGPASWSCPVGSPAGTICTYTLGAMNSGTTQSIEFAITLDNPPPNFTPAITNTATTDTDGTRGDDPTPNNNSDSDIDGILAAIGDFVWVDANRNGLQDGLENGIGGVTVTLHTSAGVVISTVQTLADGSYFFNGVIPGDYYVEFTPPTTYVLTVQDGVITDTLDSDANQATGRTITTTLSAGETDRSWDAGIYTPASIGDFVWYDRDNDGIQDVGEPGLFSITVTLYTSAGAVVTSTVTAADGSYNFNNLPPDDYYVIVTPPAGYVTSPPNQGGNPAADSDINGAGQTATITLNSGENDPTWDAGLYADPAAIGDLVWLDADQDGLYDSDEFGIENVVVNLYDFGGNFITTTTTAADGTYLFDELPPSDYYVEVVPPAGYTITGQDAGNDALDSDINGAGRTIVTTLDPNETDRTWDAGLHIPPASLGDRIWLDADQDGVQDPGEFGVSGVTVELYNNNGVLIDSTTTDSLGNYEFVNLVPGSYYVDVIPPAGYTIVPEGSGSDPDADSNIDQTTGETDVVTLAPGENNPSLDGGLYTPPAEIGNYVWLDADLNGLLDFNETGVSGVLVSLYDSTGTRIDSVLTDPNGFYLFDNLPPGDYYIEAVKPNGFAFTGQDTGNDTLDSDVDPATGIAMMTTLVAGESDLTWDIGLVPSNAELGNYVWEDLDGNGVINVGEPAVPNVTVNLYDGAGNFLNTTTTDGNGLYLFSSLDPGDYFVEFIPPIGFEFTAQNSGADTTIDSDADLVSGRTMTTTLTPGESDTTWDAGLIRTPIDPLLASLGDYVWLDENGDGLQGGQEPGVPNITVTLYDITGTVVATTTTDANGLYQFANLQPDTYSVGFTLPVSHTFTTQDVPADDTRDSDADVATGLTITTTLSAGDNDVTWDAGIIAPQNSSLAAIGNFAWIDSDGNGIQDVGEPGLSGVPVTLYDSAGVVRGLTTTGADGSYEFIDLIPGDYYVDFGVPAGYTLTVQNSGIDSAVDSDADPVTGQTVMTTLSAGENDTTWDGGFTPILNPALAAIGNYIWQDLDSDGVQDPSEPGVGSVQVNLYTAAGVLTGTTQTDGNGLYQFTDLIPGDYYVQVIPPFNMQITAQDTISDNIDSDADPVTGQTIMTTLSAGENDTTWDAGLILNPPNPLLAQLGNFVWLDSDQDGIQDAGEAGIPNISVTLFNITGTVVATTTTDANGLYLFPDLAPADYVVEFGIPAAYTVTVPNAGGDPALNSDVEPATGRTTTVTLTAGQQDLTWDLGLYQPLLPTEAAYGNYVWFDSDQDGIQDVGEAGVPGVTVVLYDVTNTLILTTTTDNNGLYNFTGLTPGDYHAEFILPNGYVFTGQNAGADLDVDSDADGDEASPTFGETAVTSLAGGENDSSWDAGIFRPTPPATASLGDFVWEDLNADGLQTPGEPGIAGVTVNIFSADGTFVNTMLTNGNGLYQFNGLIPGDYYVEVIPPSGYGITRPDAGIDELADSDMSPITGRTVTTTLTAGENDPTWDAGLFQELRIGNLIWNDYDLDGMFDPATESGVPGVVVELLDENGLPFVHPVTGLVMTTTTSAGGNYLFEGLPAGTYVVNIPSSNFDEPGDPLFNFTSSFSGQAVDPVTDPDADPGNSDDNGVNSLSPATTGIRSRPITLEAGGESVADGTDEDGSYADANSNLSVDFGFFELLQLGNQIWIDGNDNGIYDPGEQNPGAGVILYLLDGGGNPIIDPVSGRPISTTTLTDGTYLFTNLFPGEYRVQIGPENFGLGAPLAGYTSTPGSVDPDDDTDRDDNGADSDNPILQGITSNAVTLGYHSETPSDEDNDANDNTNLTIDFGLILIPNAVELLSFTAARSGVNTIKIRWTTGSEIDNFGFRLLRASQADGTLANAIQIHFESSAVTTGPGESYSYLDTNLAEGGYTYWLVDVETTGIETVHGPVHVNLTRDWQIYLPLVTNN